MPAAVYDSLGEAKTLLKIAGNEKGYFIGGMSL
jgi:hypothetical protein